MGNQAVSLRSLPLFRSAVPVGCRLKKPPPSVPQALHSTKNRATQQKSSSFFCAVSFLVSTRSLPAFVGATTSTIPLHSVSLRKLRSTAFQQYCACRPLFFRRLLLRTAIGVGTTPFSCVFRTSKHQSEDGTDIFQKLSQNAGEASIALNQGTPIG
jgi:hypothetical protein